MKPNDLMRFRNARSRQMGVDFENIISASCEYYEAHGIAKIEKTPEPMRTLRPLGNGRFEAVYTKQAQPDYKGTLYGGRAIVFEAKHTDKDRILRSVISDEQEKCLDAHEKLGADCYVLVSFGFKRFYMIPWQMFRDMELYFGRKHIKYSDYEAIDGFECKFKGDRLEFL